MRSDGADEMKRKEVAIVLQNAMLMRFGGQRPRHVFSRSLWFAATYEKTYEY